MADNKCGAKSRRTGLPCNNYPMPNGRCRMHGGKSKGAKNKQAHDGNTRAVTHGLYCNALLPEERALWDRVQLGSLDDEIRLARVKLYRLVKMSGSSEVSDLVDSAMEVAKRYEVHPTFGPMEKREIKVKTTQYGDLIVRQIDVIRKLELARRELARVDPNTPPPPQEPVTEFPITVVTPENFNPDRHGTRS